MILVLSFHSKSKDEITIKIRDYHLSKYNSHIKATHAHGNTEEVQEGFKQIAIISRPLPAHVQEHSSEINTCSFPRSLDRINILITLNNKMFMCPFLA